MSQGHPRTLPTYTCAHAPVQLTQIPSNLCKEVPTLRSPRNFLSKSCAAHFMQRGTIYVGGVNTFPSSKGSQPTARIHHRSPETLKDTLHPISLLFLLQLAPKNNMKRTICCHYKQQSCNQLPVQSQVWVDREGHPLVGALILRHLLCQDGLCRPHQPLKGIPTQCEHLRQPQIPTCSPSSLLILSAVLDLHIMLTT